jgi:hypothetical protein
VGGIITLKLSKRLKRAFKTLRAKGEKIMSSGILKQHEVFLEKLYKLMCDYGFEDVYASGDKVIFTDWDNGKGGVLSFTETHEGGFVNVESSINYSSELEHYDIKYDYFDETEVTL